MAAAALISGAPAMVAPDRISQIARAGIGGGTYDCAAGRAHRRAGRRISRSGADDGTCAC
jgi:hypothetical protein